MGWTHRARSILTHCGPFWIRPQAQDVIGLTPVCDGNHQERGNLPKPWSIVEVTPPKLYSLWRAAFACSSPLADYRAFPWTHGHAGCRGGVLGLHHARDLQPAGNAEQPGGPQPQGFTAAPAHPKRFELAGHRHARHAG